MKMKTKLLFLTLGLGLTFMLSCTKYPPQSERLLEDFAVITQYDTKIDFNNYSSFYISDTVVKITNKDTTKFVGTSLIPRIEKNMEARGFVRNPAEAPISICSLSIMKTPM
jgi:hypothetical protein